MCQPSARFRLKAADKRINTFPQNIVQIRTTFRYNLDSFLFIPYLEEQSLKNSLIALEEAASLR